MKQIYLTAIGCISLFCSSCTGSWLDTVKEGTPSENTFWKQDSDYESASTSLYAVLSEEETWGVTCFGNKELQTISSSLEQGVLHR